MSKISRTRQSYEIPEKIDHPKNLWNIEEGLLIIDKEIERVERHLFNSSLLDNGQKHFLVMLVFIHFLKMKNLFMSASLVLFQDE